MNAAYPDRRFQLWEYRVSHGALLIRSPRGPEAARNVDLAFFGVTYMACPRMMRGLEIVQLDSADLLRVHDVGVHAAETDQVFVLLSAGVRHLVVATACTVSENEMDIFDSTLG